MTEQEFKEMNDFNKKMYDREQEVRDWALSLGWKFDTKMAFLNYYIPNTTFRYEPTYRNWMENDDIYDCIYKTSEEDNFWKEEIYFKGFIESKEHLETLMKEHNIPNTKLENTGVFNQIRQGKEQLFTPDEAKELCKIDLKNLL